MPFIEPKSFLITIMEIPEGGDTQLNIRVVPEVATNVIRASRALRISQADFVRMVVSQAALKVIEEFEHAHPS